MVTLNYLYRHPDPIYFSLEKLFRAIGGRIGTVYAASFNVEETVLPFPSNRGRIFSNIRFAKKHQRTINHITGDAHYILLPFSTRHVNILTIHDCVMLHTYRPLDPRYWLLKWFWYDLPVRKADAVTVISENTKKELLHFTGCDPDKIRVIPNFVEPGFSFVPGKFNEACPSILFVGSTPNKNLDRLIGAIAGLRVKLEIVGYLNEGQEASLKEHGINYSRSSGLTAEALKRRYIDCDLLAFPSTYEGFGLPIVEAQAIGRPVLTSSIDPMKEVSGGGASLVDPYDVDSIRKGIIRIVEDAVYRDEIVKKGMENVERFSLDKIADRYVALYQELILKKNNS